MQNQSQKAPAKPPETATDQLEVRKAVEPPPISETVKQVAQALKYAEKTTRRHVCRECNDPSCNHFERKDLDTGEHFDIEDDPKYVDRDDLGK